MIKDSIAIIANYLWRESIKNLNVHLTEAELKSFSNNDYYYLTTIDHMKKPNFTQVAEALRLTKPAVSVIVGKLSRLGLIEKVQSESDKRMFFLEVTPKGKGIVEGDRNLYEGFDHLIVKLSGNDEKYRFVEELLENIVDKIEENEKVPHGQDE